MLMWIGSQANAEWIRAVFGVGSPQQIDTQVCELPELDNPTNAAVRAVVEDARCRRRVAMRVSLSLSLSLSCVVLYSFHFHFIVYFQRRKTP